MQVRTRQGFEMPPGTESPLAFALQQRDRNVKAMVAEALRTRRTHLAYQPVVRARRPDQPAFWEALMRIEDPAGRIIPARDFIDQVEADELGRQIDCSALELGLAALADEPSLRLSVNMSARSIGYPQWMRTLNRGLARTPTIAERLILEITERSAMMMPELVRVFMYDLQVKGVSFALDDFGAGYTSFRYLRDFDFDVIKIDGQFIRGIADDPDNQVLTRALLDIARHFEMFTVAESVETGEDTEWLVENGIDCLQGFYFCAPTTKPWWEDAATRRTG